MREAVIQLSSEGRMYLISWRGGDGLGGIGHKPDETCASGRREQEAFKDLKESQGV